MTEEKQDESMKSCEFCGAMHLENKIHKIHPYRPAGWAPTIPYRYWICEKCLGEQKGNVTLESEVPIVTEEVAEEEEAESPNPMAGATMQERVETVIGTKSGEVEEE